MPLIGPSESPILNLPCDRSTFPSSTHFLKVSVAPLGLKEVDECQLSQKIEIKQNEQSQKMELT